MTQRAHVLFRNPQQKNQPISDVLLLGLTGPFSTSTGLRHITTTLPSLTRKLELHFTRDRVIVCETDKAKNIPEKFLLSLSHKRRERARSDSLMRHHLH